MAKYLHLIYEQVFDLDDLTVEDIEYAVRECLDTLRGQGNALVVGATVNDFEYIKDRYVTDIEVPVPSKVKLDW